MSNYNHNNTNIRIVQMIQQLQQLNKKPSLNDKNNDFLDIFPKSINKEQINFAEVGLFLQESSILYGKQIDLLYKGFLECHKNLSDVYNDEKKDKEIVNSSEQTSATIGELEKPKKERKKCEIKKVEEQLKDTVPLITKVAEKNPDELIIANDLTNIAPAEKFSIPGIPDEILEKLKLSDCLPGGPIDEFIDKLDKDHPLYSIINKLGKEISQNKDIFTYNNLSLSGMSWNALFKIEEVLSRITRRDDELDQNDNEVTDDCQQTQTDDDSGIDTEHFISSGSSEMLDVDTTAPASTPASAENPEPSLVLAEKPEPSPVLAENPSEPKPDEAENPEHSPDLVEKLSEPEPDEAENLSKQSENNIEPTIKLTEELKEHIRKECIEKVVKINLLKLDYKLLTKKFNFRLPPEYFAERKSERIRKRKAKDDSNVPLKRKKIDVNLTQKLETQHISRSFDLELFENYCYNYYESQGIILPRPQIIETNRKSIDNRSEVSYGNPLTPADSGRFSLSFMTDSEFDHCDADDNCHDSIVPFSRADSGIEVMEPFSPASNHQDDLPECEIVSEQSDTLKTLRSLFPATFSDPERAEALKSLYKQPEDDEKYMQWKKFIDEKTANEKEFNIHECGTDILNSFSLHSTDTLNFETVVKDKSVGDISRYFVSTLQLANTYNIEIVDKQPGEIRSDNMQLKFLTNTRAHEEIDSHFNDISEDHFMHSLISSKTKRFQSTPILMRPNTQSSSFAHKSAKRKRLEYCY